MINSIIYYIVKFFNWSYRYKYHTPEVLSTLDSKKENYILAIWHQHLFQGILAQTGKQYVVIVSRSKDAAPVAFTCSKLGHFVARGSSRSKDGRDKGGKLAMEEMVNLLSEGLPGAVTVDGPKGPARKVKPGIISMAQKANIPIIPYFPIARRYWEFNSWDKFRLPKLFSTIDVYYGAPVYVGNLSMEEAIDNLEKGLNSSFE